MKKREAAHRCRRAIAAILTAMRWVFVGLLWLILGCRATMAPTPTPTPKPTATSTPEIGVSFATVVPPTAAVVQLTPSPLPTPTGTPTPTPIIYEVQSGDTLWSIALLNRTLPQTIEALNPALRPEALQIGQRLVLPPQPTALAATAAGTPIPVAIVVRSLQFYPTPYGGGWVMGEIENEGPFSAENVRIQITLFDDHGQPLGDLVTWSSAPLLPPATKAPFAVLAPNIGVAPAMLSATIVAGETTTDLGSRYLDVTVDDSTLSVDGSIAAVDATIRNSGTLTPTKVTAITTLYDAAGQVTGVTVDVVVQPIAAGEMMPFSADVVVVGSDAVRAATFVYGRLPLASALQNK